MNTIEQLFSQRQRAALSEHSPTPLYHQLYLLLRESILNGSLVHGARLPAEKDLARAFSISRITAKRAMDELAAGGLVRRERGRGSYVTHRYRPQPIKAPLIGMLSEIEDMARHSTVRVLENELLPPPAPIREEFGLGEQDKALSLVRVRLADGLPFGFYRSWTVGLRGKVTNQELREKPRLEIFRDNGLGIAHVRQVLSATAATAEVATTLDVAEGAPLISLLRRSFNDREELVDYLHVLYHPDRFQYQMDLRPEKTPRRR